MLARYLEIGPGCNVRTRPLVMILMIGCVFLILLLMLTRLQCVNKTPGDNFDALMCVFLILLLMLTRLQCDNNSFGDDFNDFGNLMCVFLILLLMLTGL